MSPWFSLRTCLAVTCLPALLLVSGCGGGDEETSDSFIPETVLVHADPTLAQAVLDEQNVVRLGTATTAQRVLDQPGQWAVDYAWFYLMKEPVTLYTMAQMDSLAGAGAINDSTVVAVARYRMRFEAESQEDITQKAMTAWPNSVPKELHDAAQPRPRTQTITFDTN